MNPTTFSVVTADEIYIYVNGQLVMKRWIRHGYSRTFYWVV